MRDFNGVTQHRQAARRDKGDLREAITAVVAAVCLGMSAGAAAQEAADATELDPNEPGRTQTDEPAEESTGEAQPQNKLENIVVVAQRKKQLNQDVPVSISVVDQRLIQEWSLTDLNTATLYTPNVQIADAGFFIMPRIRGFGTDQNNKGFEPPGGVAIDGIPYTRLEYFTAALFDLDRMEVYRGPQGTAFGKNTTAGLIHLITESPTDTYQGRIDVQYGDDFDRRRIEAGFGGPLIENFLNFRVSALSDQRRGFVENSATSMSLSGAPEYGRGNNRQGVRLKLNFTDLFGSNLLLSAESVRIEAIGAGIEVFNVDDNLQQVIRQYEPNSDFTRANYVNSINDPDSRLIGMTTFNANWRYNVGSWGLVALGGYSVLDDEAALDTDVTPVPALFSSDKDRSPTTTAEVRLESPDFDGFLGIGGPGHSSFLAGAYYQKRDIQGEGIVFGVGLPFLDLLLSGFSTDPNVLSMIPQVQGLLAVINPLVPPILGGTDAGYAEDFTQDFDQQAVARALFTQMQWDFTDTWGMEYGIRFNQEDKDAQFNQFYSSDTAILLPVLGVREYTADLTRSENDIAQRVALKYEPSSDYSIFVHWARGFRSGGYNAFSFTGEPDTLEFDPESATDIGLDFKSTLLDGRMRLNVSLFRLDVSGFQVLVNEDSPTGFGLGSNSVENADKARSQGVEADLAWLVTDWFRLFSTLGINDTEYLDFENNRCFPDNPDTDGDGNPSCDATGKPFPLTPKYTGTLLGMATLPLPRGLLMQLGGGFDYRSSQFANTSLDPRFKEGPTLRLRASIGIGDPVNGWSFRLQGENLTNEVVTIRQGQIFRGAVVEGTEAPRTIYGVFHYSY